MFGCPVPVLVLAFQVKMASILFRPRRDSQEARSSSGQVLLPRGTMRFVFWDCILGLLANQDALKAACKRRLQVGSVETRKSLEAQASRRTKKTAETRKRLCWKGHQVNQVLTG
jgi:hypothetical protein